MTTRVLNAFANDRQLGSLTDDNGIWSFVYSHSWVEANDAFPLSPAFPIAITEMSCALK